MTRRLFALAALWPVIAAAQVAADANASYRTPENREHMSAVLLSADRTRAMAPDAIIKALELKPGMSVADIGTGAGFLLPYLSKAVGPQGHVIAEDIYQDFLEKAEARASEFHLKNVRFVKGSEKYATLPPASCDRLAVVDVYHHFDYPKEMLASLRAALKDDGRLMILDYYRRPDAMPGGMAMQHIRAGRTTVIREVTDAGFHLVESRDHVKGKQYIAIFEKRKY